MERLRPMYNPSKSYILGFSAFLYLILGFSNCYYSTEPGFQARKIQSVVIPLFKNNTVEIGIQEALTDAVTENFLSNGQYHIVNPQQADTIIRGTITGILEESVAFSENTIAREVRLWIEVDVRFQFVESQEIIWEEKQLRTFGDYKIETGTDTDREPAIEIAIGKMADEILNQSISGW